MVILAVDYGDARTGLAVCDKNETLCSPAGTVAERNTQRLLEAVIKTAREKSAEMLVVGLPLNMDGTSGERAQKSRGFAEMLSKASGLFVEMYDERCTTAQAANALNFTDTRGKKRKAVIDSVSAVIILEGYLARRHNTANKKE